LGIHEVDHRWHDQDSFHLSNMIRRSTIRHGPHRISPTGS
jgi:hypothetical protein